MRREGGEEGGGETHRQRGGEREGGSDGERVGARGRGEGHRETQRQSLDAALFTCALHCFAYARLCTDGCISSFEGFTTLLHPETRAPAQVLLRMAKNQGVPSCTQSSGAQKSNGARKAVPSRWHPDSRLGYLF